MSNFNVESITKDEHGILIKISHVEKRVYIPNENEIKYTIKSNPQR